MELGFSPRVSPLSQVPPLERDHGVGIALEVGDPRSIRDELVRGL
jgi:hypothetical protein